MSLDENNKYQVLNDPGAPPAILRKLPVVDLIQTYYKDSTELTDEILSRGKGAQENLKAFNKGHSVCGRGNYVKNAYWRQNPEHTGPCQKCPVGAVATLNDINSTTNQKGREQKYIDAQIPYPPDTAEFSKMCGTDIYNWFPAQYAENPYTVNYEEQGVTSKWKRIGTVITTGSGSQSEKELASKWYTDRATDHVDDRTLKHYKDIANYPGDLSDMKKDISDYTKVPCVKTPTGDFDTYVQGLATDNSINLTIPLDNCLDVNALGVGTMGPEVILEEQFRDWSDHNDLIQPKTDRDTVNTLGKFVLPPNPDFETCMNNLLEDNLPQDQDMIQQIHEAKTLSDLSKQELLFIRKKLSMLVVDATQDDIITCVTKSFNIDTSICEAGLTEQMNFILTILFSIIGVQVSMDDPTEKLMEAIDIIGDIIPKALERIVEISKRIEIDTCGKGRISKNTMVLEELYKKIFKPQKNVIDFNFGISDMISSATNQEFDRSTVLAVLAIAFLKYF